MKLLFFVCLLPLQLLSQDITGIWTGTMQTNGSALPFELVISSDLTGYSLTTFTINGVENAGIKSIKFKQKKDILTLTDGELVFSDYSSPTRRVKLVAIFRLTSGDTASMLNGSFQTKSLDFRAVGQNEYSGTITLQKQNNAAKTKLVAKLDELNLLRNISFMPPATIEKSEVVTAVPVEKETRAAVITARLSTAPVTRDSSRVRPGVLPQTKAVEVRESIKPAAELAIRKTEVIRSISFASDSIVLTLYDNGIVDGDTVSVVLNNRVIIPRQGLSEKAFRLVVPVTADLGDSLLLVMYAENLGSIPPNTGLLILEEGENRHEIRFEGDLQKSSAVILRRRK